MKSKTMANARDVSFAEEAIYHAAHRYHNQALVDLFETIAQIIREIRRERK